MKAEIEAGVALHYAQDGLERLLIEAVAATGRDTAALTQADLSLVDEFHIGGRKATVDLASRLPLRPGLRLLDVGCGVGGPARYFAAEHGCVVSGIDLTPDFVAAATALALRVGLGEQVDYRQASALDMPFEAGAFDGAYMLHVGMNIAGKAALFAEVRRVLRPGGFFAIYDVMRAADGDLRYPVPWASEPAFSSLDAPGAYRRLLTAAGFEVASERDRSAFGLATFEAMAATPAKAPPPVLVSPQKRENLVFNLKHGLIAPVEMIAFAA